MYCNEGNNILTAYDMHAALTAHPLKGASPSVNAINQSVSRLKVKKLNHFNAFHNFRYEEDGIRVWQAHSIGQGKKFKYEDIYITHQHETNLLVDKEFAVKDPSRLPIPTQKEATSQESGLFYCTEARCNYSCSLLDDLDLHESFGEHCRSMNNKGLYGIFRREWTASYSTVTQMAATDDISDRLARLTTLKKSIQLQMGWALSKPRTGATRFPQKVRDYLITRFDLGEATGNKADPNQVSLDMRAAKKNRIARDVLRGMSDSRKHKYKDFFPDLQKQKAKDWHLPWR